MFVITPTKIIGYQHIAKMSMILSGKTVHQLHNGLIATQKVSGRICLYLPNGEAFTSKS